MNWPMAFMVMAARPQPISTCTMERLEKRNRNTAQIEGGLPDESPDASDIPRAGSRSVSAASSATSNPAEPIVMKTARQPATCASHTPYEPKMTPSGAPFLRVVIADERGDRRAEARITDADDDAADHEA